MKRNETARSSKKRNERIRNANWYEILLNHEIIQKLSKQTSSSNLMISNVAFYYHCDEIQGNEIFQCCFLLLFVKIQGHEVLLRCFVTPLMNFLALLSVITPMKFNDLILYISTSLSVVLPIKFKAMKYFCIALCYSSDENLSACFPL